ncbi:Transmembrane protease serine 9 [Acropora cervicornis]|uniref:Transmembrane protease serine 9 n=1 Tax=Acropora cervicornis TaxID=6130 RepID=A0AAD9UYS9_ACRCE|nr:Transmembrane protease serine 9 [Acropora cervicornis]
MSEARLWRDTSFCTPRGYSCALCVGQQREIHFELQDINISSVIVHPSYGKAAAFDSDLAIIELASPARMNDHVGPACLQDTSSDFPSGNECSFGGE